MSVERGWMVLEPTTSSSSRMMTGNSLKSFSFTLARRRIDERFSLSLYASVTSSTRSAST